ncbi:MAG: hypothetical protein DRP78_02010 [Candidatus Omnitrophota bacterium]|nr:MAG: hypothetical protein DRP78_02010 [Candidatus Omnitrophota bacterium]
MMQLAFPRRHVVCYKGFHRDIFRNLLLKGVDEEKVIREFERKFAEHIGVKYAVAVSSGRGAFSLLLKILDIKNGDEVLIPAITHPSIPLVIKNMGAKPIYADVSKDSFVIQADQLEKKVTDKTKVVVATHLFGIPCDVKSIIDFAIDKKIKVIEDCAHGIGVEVEGRKVGSFGDAAFFSFETTKFINTLGGGMIVTGNRDLYLKIRKDVDTYRFPTKMWVIKKIARFYIHKLYTNRLFFSIAVLPLSFLLNTFNVDSIQLYKKHRKVKTGIINIQYTSLQSVLGLRQLDMVKERSNKIIKNSKLFKKELSSSKINYINAFPGAKDILYIFSFLVENRDVFQKLLYKKGIEADKDIFGINLELFKDNQLNNSMNFLSKVLLVSLNVDLNERDIFYIANTINEISRKLNV